MPMNVTARTEAPLPTLPSAVRDADASKQIMHTLRHFHLGNPQARDKLEPVSADTLPALLDPFRDSSRLRYDYPLYLAPPSDSTESVTPDRLARPLARLLRETVDGFAPGEEAARILKDNLPWLERDLRRRLGGSDGEPPLEGPVPARPLLQRSAQRLLEHLALDQENGGRLQADLDRLLERIPEQGQLLGYGHYPAIQLLIHVVRSLSGPRLARFQEQVQEGIRDLTRLLEVEKGKSLEAIEPARLRESAGAAADLLDPEALSHIMDHSHGSLRMPESRRRRVEQALATLQGYREDPVRIRFIHVGSLADDSWLQQQADVEVLSDPDPVAQAATLFDRKAERLAEVFAALRIARLERDDLYDPSIHDPWFARFDWEGFSRDELQLVPTVIALEGADRMAGAGMAHFSRLLNSGRPVQVMIRVQAHNNPGARPDEDPFSAYRTELGYLGIAHRQAFVAQTSAARHEHLLAGYLQALDATRTSLHLINTGLRTVGTETSLNGWLVAGAALEGRVHPFFRVDPSRGDHFADRMEFDGNPQVERDWPVHPFAYRDESGNRVEQELAFTFADYALLMPRLRHHFALVPALCESDDLLPLADYLALPREEAPRYLPYVWGVDRQGTLQQLVISRTLVHACRDRLNFWHSLQEMAGVRNRYVEQAETRVREQAEAAAAARIDELQAQHQAELAQARAETAGEVMGRLTEVLMGMDLTSAGIVARPATPAPAAETAAADTAPGPEEETDTTVTGEEEEEEIGGFDDPWIDSPLCTSCNDCLAINPIMFVYNENNQAIIADTSAGTYAQLVEAAEICPSRCIHPGKPLNPDEPGLDELVERAAVFN